MLTLFTIILILACVLLLFFVLIQNSKGGGLAAGASTTTQLFGVQQTTDILEKSTWILIGIIVVCSMGINYFAKDSVGKANEEQSRIKNKIENATVPTSRPSAPSNGGNAIPSGLQQPAK